MHHVLLLGTSKDQEALRCARSHHVVDTVVRRVVSLARFISTTVVQAQWSRSVPPDARCEREKGCKKGDEGELRRCRKNGESSAGRN